MLGWILFLAAFPSCWILAAVIGDARSRRRMVPLALFVWVPIGVCLFMASGVIQWGPRREDIGWLVAGALFAFCLFAYLLGVLVLVEALDAAKKRGVNFRRGLANGAKKLAERVRSFRGFSGQ